MPSRGRRKDETILPGTAEICAYGYESPAFRVLGTHTHRNNPTIRRMSVNAGQPTFSIVGITFSDDNLVNRLRVASQTAGCMKLK